MITITDKITDRIPYDLSRYGKPEDILFFDIETTGLSPDYCSVYLIGCVFYSDGFWYLKQFFADSINAEGEILFHFFTMLSKYSVLIHFNGDAFDIPFIKKRADMLNIPHTANKIESLDIYRRIKPFKNLLGLSNCKQKTIELLLGINREDKYNGGQLIEVYKDYLKTQNEEEKRLLLLHNADDLKGMPALLAALNYEMLFNGEGHIDDIYLSEEADLSGNKQNINSENVQKLKLTATFSDIKFPSPITIEKDNYTVILKDSTVNIKLNSFTGELKHYYSDYKNYYYLPDEDMAIHKSVAEFVDKAHKIKATAKTCYTRKYGSFIPGFSKMNVPLFYNEYPLKKPYILIDENMIRDKKFLTENFCLIINSLK